MPSDLQNKCGLPAEKHTRQPFELIQHTDKGLNII